MKKIITLLLLCVCFLCGCQKESADTVVDNFAKKVNDTKSYVLKGNMEIYADEETFTYSIEVNYLQDNFYKAIMVNQTNNHEQIILRNSDAVYVITPSLNKSFKFQSDWPNNSSQAYLLSSIVKDMKNDTGKSITEENNQFIIKSSVNYPNNPELKYQKTTLDKDGNIKKNEVYDEKDKLKMKVTFSSIDYKAGLKETHFKLEDYIKETTNDEETKDDSQNKTTKDENNTTNSNEKCDKEDCNSKQSGSIENILYPLYVPTNTYLSKSDKIKTEEGDRVILTFAGDKSFVLVEEKVNAAEEFEIVPVYGEPLIVSSTVGALGTNSLTWTNGDMSYYLVGSDLSASELLAIGKSIGNNNLSVSKEK